VFNIDITKVESGVTFNVNVTGTPTVNIQTSGGANIVIDKLTQGAYTEDRRTLSNNGASAIMLSTNYTYRKGKLFPRGCRGFIRTVEVYCQNTDSVSHSFTIYFAVQPGMGAVFTATLTVDAGAAAAWRSVDVERFWNYDSLFVYVRGDSDSYILIGSDSGSPYDYYYSSDEISWIVGSSRIWVRLNLSGLTVGDLPVSGTLNVIQIPNTASRRDSGTIQIPAQSTVFDTPIRGSGELTFIFFQLFTEDACSSCVPLIYADGANVLPTDASFTVWRNTILGSSQGPIYIGVWDSTLGRFNFIVAMRIPFKRELKVGVQNIGNSAVSAWLGYTYTKIE
jgi:hypothetical protein